MKNNRCLLILGSVTSLLLAGALALALLVGGSPDYSHPEAPVPPTILPDSRLPQNWGQLDRVQKFRLNYHHCLSRSEISPEHGRCQIDDNHDDQLEAEYIYISRSGPHAGSPMPQVSYLYLAVPDSATNEQVGVVFENYVSYRRYDRDFSAVKGSIVDKQDPLGVAGQLGVTLVVIYNYSDVVFGDNYFQGWDSAADPRVAYASGPGGVAYEYLGNEVFASGRDGADLASDCIALDLSFLILSESSPDQLRAYYSDEGPFGLILDGYLKMGPGYDLRFPEGAGQKRRTGNVNYDILVKLYRADAKEYYLNPHDAEYGETYRHPDLPSITLNGCQ